jgi:hypothetical protein
MSTPYTWIDPISKRHETTITISKTSDRSIYLFAHEGEYPTNEAGYIIIRSWKQLSNQSHDYFIHQYPFMNVIY